MVISDSPDAPRRLSAEVWADAVRASGYEARIVEALEGYIPPIPVPDWAEAERASQELRGRQAAAAYREAAMRRPAAWAGAKALPSPGCFCGTCSGQRWWSERTDPRGWRCAWCYPPAAGPQAVHIVNSAPDPADDSEARHVLTDYLPAKATRAVQT